MADAAIQSPPSLSKDYLLPSEEKPAQSKPVEVAKEEAPVSVTSSEVSSEATTAVAEESSGAPTGTTETSTEESADSNETSVEEITPAAEEGSEAPEQDDSATEEAPEVKLETAPADFRFPTTNQTRHCFTRYIEYHRCVAAKGDDAPECDKFAKYYRALCPGEWVDRWNEQRENGTFPGPL
ncbi:hypothetical protein vseg_018861 [Gypsophila vaccaria]